MAAQLKLIKSPDVAADISTLDLYNNAAGVQLLLNGWNPKIATDDDASVTEILSFVIAASSHDNLAVRAQAIDDYLRQVSHYQDSPPTEDAIWLRAQLTNETSARQALIRNFRSKVGNPLMGAPVSPGNVLPNYTLALERLPWWEASAVTTYTDAAGISSLGGMYSYGTVVGDTPGRIATMLFEAGTTASTMSEVWLGFRTARFGDAADLETVWECEDGTLTNDTAIVAEVSTASNDSKARCSFSSEAMATRVSLSVNQVVASSANYKDQRGSFTILLRAKLTAGSTTCRVRLLDGLSSNTAFRTRSRVVITSTAYTFYDLGSVDIPGVKSNYQTDNVIDNYALMIQAERTAGAGDLDMDCLVLIPTAEGSFHADTLQIYDSGNATTKLFALTTDPLDRAHGISYDNNNKAVMIADVNPTDFSIPVGAGYWVLAAQRVDHKLTDTVKVTAKIVPRWRTLRGAE